MQKHEAIKELILSRPELVGIKKENVLEVYTEYPLLRRKRPVAQPDVVIVHNSDGCVRKRFVEVKSSDNRQAIIDLHSQMKKVSKYLRYKKIRGDVVGVYCKGSISNIALVY